MSFGVPIRNGLGLGLLASTSLATADGQFNPSSLFASGAPGFLIDATLFNLSSLFQDSAGTTPVTAIEQPVGRALDTSGGGNHFVQTTSAARPTLSARVNLLLATATLSTQSVTTVAATYTLAFSGAGSITLSGTAIGVYTAGTYSVVCTAGTLTLTVLSTVTTADLRAANDGVGLPAYQAVVTSSNYDTTDFPLYLNYDGVDDSLASQATVNLSTTAQVSVFVGARKLVLDATFQAILEHSSNPNINDGSFSLSASTTTGDAARRTWCGVLTNTGSLIGAAAIFAAPDTRALSLLLDTTQATAATKLQLKLNAVLQTLTFSGSSTGTANFGNFTSYIGCRGSATNPFNGRTYFPIVVLGRTATATEIANMESFINTRNGIY